jgi:hypothetical protein
VFQQAADVDCEEDEELALAGSPKFFNCLFHNHTAEDVTVIHSQGQGQIGLTNCTITDNALGLFHENDCTRVGVGGVFNISNSIIWDNGDDSFGDQFKATTSSSIPASTASPPRTTTSAATRC